MGAAYAIATDSFAIGSDPENSLCLAGPSVSREHCVILRHGVDFTISDLGRPAPHAGQ
jgi:pSer/pThr/pTyr-binding forkhead associated (FHA) protein